MGYSPSAIKTKTMPKICLRVNDGTYCKRRMMAQIGGIEGVESVAEDTKERIITVIGDTDPVSLCRVLRENGFSPELLSVGPSREDKTLGSKCDTENRGRNHYLGVQRLEAVGGFGGMNRAIEDKEGSEKGIVEVVAGFGDFTSIEVDIKKGMVTVVGKSVPVSVALKVREMGYRAKLLSLGPATEEEDPDEEHNDDLYPRCLYPNVFYTDEDSTTPCTIAR